MKTGPVIPANLSVKSFIPKAVILEERPMIAATVMERFGDALHAMQGGPQQAGVLNGHGSEVVDHGILTVSARAVIIPQSVRLPCESVNHRLWG